MANKKSKRDFLKSILSKIKGAAYKAVPGKGAAANLGKTIGSISAALRNKRPKSVVRAYVWNKMSKGKPLSASSANVTLAEEKVRELMKKIKERRAKKANKK